MKKFLWYNIAAVSVALGITYTIGWPFLVTFILLETAYWLYVLHATYPRLVKWLSVAATIALVSGWAWSNFKDNFPLSYSTMPYGKNRADSELARLMDPGLSKARAVLIIELQKKEDALADSIPTLMRAGKYGQVKTNAQELIDLRKEIEKLMAQMVPPPTPKLAKATASARSTLPGITLEIALTNEQVYAVSDLHQGQHWRYLSFIGALSHRIDKGDGQASWKLVDNNLPWNADYAGQLQVKAGNTPVKLTVNITP